MTHASPLVLSVHIPKTGGSTFRDLLVDQGRGQVYFDYDQRPLSPSAWHAATAVVRHLIRSRRIRRQTRTATGPIFVHGHFVATKYERRWPQSPIITWFRDPVERLASHYHFWQRRPDFRNRVCRQLHDRHLTLEEFARLPELQNVHARFLAGVPPDALAFVGITEEFDRSVDLFTRIFFGPTHRTPVIVKKNVNAHRGNRYALEPEVRQAVAALNRTDLDLMAVAQQRFAELCRVHGLG